MSIDNPKEEQNETAAFYASAEQQADIDYAIQFKEEAYNQTRQEREEWRNTYERYRLSRQLSEYDYIPDIHLGLTYDAVERSTAALPGREFGFMAKPIGKEDSLNAILFSEALKNAWQSPEVMDGPSKMDVVKKNMALFGNCFYQAYWDIKTDANGEVVKSDPGFYPLNIFNVYYNKFISELEDLPEIGYLSIVSLGWFKQNAENLGFKNWKAVKGVDATQQSGGLDEDGASIAQEETRSGRGEKNKIVRLFEVQSASTILTLALDEQTIWLRKIPNKLGRISCGLFRFKRNPLPDRLLGITDITKGGEIEDAIQRVMNQAVFNTLLVDNPNYTYDATDRDIDPRTFVAAPGAGIPRGKDPNSITPIRFDSHLNESFAMVNMLLERWRRVTNVSDMRAGVGDTAVDSATEASILDQNAKSIDDKIVDGMKGTMQKLAILIRRMYEVYGPESISIKVYSPGLLEKLSGGIPQQDGAAEFAMAQSDFVLPRDIEVTVDFTTQNKSVLSQKLISFLGMTARDPLVPPQLRIQGYQQWLEFNDLTDLAQTFAEVVGQSQSSDLALADKENMAMMNGQQVPSTPNATPEHTQRHIEFMRRPETGQEVDRMVEPHIEGELQAHQMKAQGGGMEQAATGMGGNEGNQMAAEAGAPASAVAAV